MYKSSFRKNECSRSFQILLVDVLGKANLVGYVKRYDMVESRRKKSTFKLNVECVVGRSAPCITLAW